MVGFGDGRTTALSYVKWIMNGVAIQADSIRQEIFDRFGTIPSFFELSFPTPELAWDLWRQAQVAYLDNPLPFRFKERLFVYLSRFCNNPYCLGRHVAMLLTPNPATVGPNEGPGAHSATDIAALLDAPAPSRQELLSQMDRLNDVDPPLEQWPSDHPALEHSLFVCSVATFLRIGEADLCSAAIRSALAPVWSQRLELFLAFVRRAHDWTESHRELKLEPEITALLSAQPALAKWMDRWRPGDAVRLKNEWHQGVTAPGDAMGGFFGEMEHELTRWRTFRNGKQDAASGTNDDIALLMRIQNLAMQATQVGVLIADARAPDFPVVYCNSSFEKMTGYRSEEIVGRNCRFLQADDRDQFEIHVMRQALRQGSACTVTLRNYRKDGSMFWNEISLSPIHNDRGELTHYVSIERDVTERQQSLTDLKRERLLLDALSDGTPFDELLRLIVTQAESSCARMSAAIFLIDDDGQSLRCACAPRLSPELRCRMERVPIEPGVCCCTFAASQRQRQIIPDIHLHERSELIHPLAKAAGIRSCWAEPILSTQRDVLGVLSMFSTHAARPTETELSLLSHFAQLAGVVIQRSQAARRLAKSEERLRLALRATNDAIWDIDLLRQRMWWNEVFDEQFGGPSGDVDVDTWWHQHIHPDDLRRVISSPSRAVEGRADDSKGLIEYRLMRRDGTYAVVKERTLLSRDAEGQPARLLGALTDLTQRRALEKEVLEIAAAQSWRIGNDLHDGVGQELTGMGMLADALGASIDRDVTSVDLASLRRIAGKLRESVHRTLRQVRTLARGMNPVDVDRHGLTSALTEMCDRIRELHGVNCRFECDRPVPFRENQTATQLYRIAQEAVTNAVRHGEAANIRVRLGFRDDQWSLRIQDDGVGISKKPNADRGMGLRTMDYRAGQIGGQIQIGPRPDGGTEVACIFPGDAVAQDDEEFIALLSDLPTE
ncbi:Blue-light photoreceptor [Crateriforma conspicua]|nr:Blue-light photoreceptor [Crateriforma conspicua]